MSYLTLNNLAADIHAANVEKGFYEDFFNLEKLVNQTKNKELIKALNQTFDAQRIALIQSEASEALEANRKVKLVDDRLNQEWKKEHLEDSDSETFKKQFELFVKDTEEDEISDTFIRLMDYAGFKGIDLNYHVKAKLRYNSLRPKKHGKSF